MKLNPCSFILYKVFINLLHPSKLIFSFIFQSRVITNNSINHKEVLLKIEEGIEKEENVESENTGASVSKVSIL